ncbi:MAG: HAMP domain-containing sensor histidine kinase [Cyanobacteria bacterium P01_H01_bin.15]
MDTSELPVLSSLFRHHTTPKRVGLSPVSRFQAAQVQAKEQWEAGIAALEILLVQQVETLHAAEKGGLVLAGPAPVFAHPHVCERFQSTVFRPQARSLYHRQLPTRTTPPPYLASQWHEFTLLNQDPLIQEQFCLVLTPEFGVLLVLGQGADGLPRFEFSFEPEIILRGWFVLRSRLQHQSYPVLACLSELIKALAPSAPDYRVVSEYLRHMSDHLALPNVSVARPLSVSAETAPPVSLSAADNEPLMLPRRAEEVEFLQALTHEVRTPLTTIRTLVRSLLKRHHLSDKVAQRLQAIDQECTQQIERMELIFRAAELHQKDPDASPLQGLSSVPLAQLFAQSIPKWQRQAARRQVQLDLNLPETLPTVLSDARLLNPVLTGLIEKTILSLPVNGNIQIHVTISGSQLKVEFVPNCWYEADPFQALGNFLTVQPQTGGVALNIDVTKDLFQSVGGKLTVRKRHDLGDIFTLFLPLETSSLFPAKAAIQA